MQRIAPTPPAPGVGVVILRGGPPTERLARHGGTHRLHQGGQSQACAARYTEPCASRAARRMRARTADQIAADAPRAGRQHAAERPSDLQTFEPSTRFAAGALGKGRRAPVDTFKAYRVSDEGGRIAGRLTDLRLEDLDGGEVVIRAAYSSVNYKDALAATGAGKIMRRFPLVGGIDVAGRVESSSDPQFTPGDEVLVTGYDLGAAHDGGYAAFVRVPAGWVVPVPAGMR